MSCALPFQNDKPSAPNPANVGYDYTNLVNQYVRGMPQLLGAEQMFKPGFVQSNANAAYAAEPTWLNLFGAATGSSAGAINNANTSARSANTMDVSRLGGAAGRAVQSINPGGSALMDQLTQSASSQVAAGGQLMPQDVNRISQGVRGDWANRGLGGGDAAQLDEAMQLYGGGEQARQSRESFASGVAGQDFNQVTAPALGLLTTQSQAPNVGLDLTHGSTDWATHAGASLFPAQQSYDLFNTAYNARAASNIAGANNAAAVTGSAMSY